MTRRWDLLPWAAEQRRSLAGLAAQGDYYLPLATTEAALVASYDRGARIITEAGCCAAITLNEGVSRSPAFAFRTLLEACRFVQVRRAPGGNLRRRGSDDCPRPHEEPAL